MQFIELSKFNRGLKKYQNGFTLIEIIVATSIFIIVMFIAVGAILSMVDANRKTRAMSSVVSNLNVALESMVRDIRTGTGYQIANGPTVTSLTFDNYLGQRTTYALSNNNRITKQVGTNGVGEITAPEVVINSMKFTARGVGLNDQRQPIILLQIIGTVGAGKYTSPFTIQTLLTQRLLET
jgi:type II secretory pathway pseudopilin PulG